MLVVEEKNVNAVKPTDNSIKDLVQKILKDGLTRESVITAKNLQSQNYGIQQKER